MILSSASGSSGLGEDSGREGKPIFSEEKKGFFRPDSAEYREKNEMGLFSPSTGWFVREISISLWPQRFNLANLRQIPPPEQILQRKCAVAQASLSLGISKHQRNRSEKDSEVMRALLYQCSHVYYVLPLKLSAARPMFSPQALFFSSSLSPCL